MVTHCKTACSLLYPHTMFHTVCSPGYPAGRLQRSSQVLSPLVTNRFSDRIRSVAHGHVTAATFHQPRLSRKASAIFAKLSAEDAIPAKTMTLQSLLQELAPLGPTRVIAVLPGASAILEASSDSTSWQMKTTTMPSGKTLLTVALPDDTGVAGPSFEFHVDTAEVVRATLGMSPKTGGPIVRLLNEGGSSLLTLLPSKNCTAQFEVLVGALSDEVELIP